MQGDVVDLYRHRPVHHGTVEGLLYLYAGRLGRARKHMPVLLYKGLRARPMGAGNDSKVCMARMTLICGRTASGTQTELSTSGACHDAKQS